MIGYKVTAKGFRSYVRMYSGWFEGSPKLESKAKEIAAKAVMKQVLKRLAGGPVVTVADILSKPLQGLGQAAGQLIAANLLKINRARADQGMMVHDIDVTLTGDFEAEYQIRDPKDLDQLPKLLALIPQKGTTNSFMGAGVLEAAYMAQVNYARWLYNLGRWTVRHQTVRTLTVKIEL